VKECPVPTIFTVARSSRADPTARATSSADAGEITRLGSADSSPDQFCHCTSASLGDSLNGAF
jgi:hypothetical protein